MNNTAPAAAPTQAATPVRPTGRLASIDLIKAIAVLMVVVYHISLCSYKVFDDPAIDTLATFYLRCFLVVCVPLFFMANGYLLLPHKLDLRSHCIKILRLWLITLFWAAPTLAIELRLEGGSMSLLEFMTQLNTFTGVEIHLWYMGALVCIYIFFPLIKLAYDRSRPIFLLFIAFTALTTFGSRLINQFFTLIDAIGGARYYGEPTDKWFSIFNPYNGIYGYTLVYFCLGGLVPDMLARLQKKYPAMKSRNLLLTGCLLLGSLIHFAWFLFIYHKRNWYMCPIWYGYKTVSAVIMTVSAFLLCMNYRGQHRLPARLLQVVSGCSLGVYFLHMLVLLPLKPFVQAHMHWLCNLPGNVLLGLVVTAICVLVTLLIRRIPLLRQLLKL